MNIPPRRIATIVIFAVIYALLSQIPVSKLLGTYSVLTMAEIFSPLAGMVLGPFAGAASVLIGTFLAAATGHPLAFDGLDFVPPVAAAVTGGLVIKGRAPIAVGFSVLLFAVYMADPLSLDFVFIDGVPIPYLWMHMVAAVSVLVYYFLRGPRTGSAGTSGSAVATVLAVFLSTMNAHVAGAIMYENVLVRINGTLTPEVIKGIWHVVFYLYPVERVFFTVAGSLLAIPVLRVLPRQMLKSLRGDEPVESRVREPARSE